MRDLPQQVATGVWASAQFSQATGATDQEPRPCSSTLEVIKGASPSIQRLRKDIQRIATIPVDVMLYGETGTGKDLAVQQLHALSGRSGTLVALNCGAIPDALFESELFGHEIGAFTGASRSRMGAFEQANKGTLFLDEIDSMPMNQQVKLLRVLETRRVDRVGGSGVRPVLDLRVFAASQGPLDEACRQGRFRLDLWHRLNVVTFELPPLRERRGDVPELWRHYVGEACAQYGIDGDLLGEAEIVRLCAYDWPGNVRELKHAAQRFVLGLEALPHIAKTREPSPRLDAQLASYERELIVATLQRNERRIKAAARELGISEKTLSRRVGAYRLNAGPPFAG